MKKAAGREPTGTEVDISVAFRSAKVALIRGAKGDYD